MEPPSHSDSKTGGSRFTAPTSGKWYDGLLRTVLVDAKAHIELEEKVSRVPPAPRGELKVIGAGMSRTGTLSLYAAFTILGLRSYHGAELGKRNNAEKWRRVLEQDLRTGNVKGVDWAEVVDGYNAGCDLPFCDYYKELADAFPEAKIVLTHRDSQVWWNSIVEVIIKSYTTSRLHGFATWWFPGLHGTWVVSRLAFLRYSRQPDGLGPHTLERRIDEVKRNIAPERLLVYQVQEGWEPLCKFLDLPIPDEPFPRINDAETMKYIFQTITFVGLSLWACATAVAGGIGYYVYTHVLV